MENGTLGYDWHNLEEGLGFSGQYDIIEENIICCYQSDDNDIYLITKSNYYFKHKWKEDYKEIEYLPKEIKQEIKQNPQSKYLDLFCYNEYVVKPDGNGWYMGCEVPLYKTYTKIKLDKNTVIKLDWEEIYPPYTVTLTKQST